MTDLQPQSATAACAADIGAVTASVSAYDAAADLPRAYDRLRAIYVASLAAIDRMGTVAEELIRQTERRHPQP